MNSEPTIKLVSLALDAALMRQTAIAYNVANSNSPNAQTMEVNFEQQLDEQALITNAEDPSAITPFYQLSEQHSSVDEQMALSVQNSTQYRALIKGLNQKLAIMKLALQGNNQ
ncbi:MAG: hypothetical protein ACHP65_01335 [Legionellales bacterium]